MLPIIDILILTLQGLASVFFEPMFWGIILIIGYQYYRMQKAELRMFGVSGASLVQKVLWAIFYGTVGGFIGSLFAVGVGVAVNRLGIAYIWPVALILMMFDMRFLCFAYAGGLVALAKIIFGWPNVDVPQVLALVAVLHITESILIYISGRYGASPVIVRREDGRLIGGFSLQNFWPLPVMLMAAVAIPSGEITGVNMPDWWPLIPIGQDAPEGKEWMYLIIPVVAALGYTDVALTSLPSKRRRLSALHLAFYSITLLVLSILSAHYTFLQFIAALASPLGHEMLIQFDGRKEKRGKPLFVPPEHGVMILDTVYNSEARRLGLKPADIILTFNGADINGPSDLSWAIEHAYDNFYFDVVREDRTMRFTGKFTLENKQLGVILVPYPGYDYYYMNIAFGGRSILDWIKHKFG